MSQEHLRAHIHWKLPKEYKHPDGSFSLPTNHRVYFPGRGDDAAVHVSDLEKAHSFACPSEILLAAVSSSQMLSYLRLCANHHIPVQEYHDHGEIAVHLDERGERQIDYLLLRPLITFDCEESPYIRASVVRFLNEALSHSLVVQSLNAKVRIDPRLVFRR